MNNSVIISTAVEPYRKGLSEKIGLLYEEEEGGGGGGVEVFSDSGLGHLETKKNRAGQAEKFLEMCQQPSAALVGGGWGGMGWGAVGSHL